jgi:hypothetical protein
MFGEPRIVLLSAQGLGTNAIMRVKSKTCVWHWQERFAAEGVDGLLRDKTRPLRIARLDLSVTKRAVALTLEAPPGKRRIGPARRWPVRRRQRVLGSARLACARAPAASRPAVQALRKP